MFITFEGIEGSGKSTALRGLKKYLLDEGFQVLCTREPGGSALGKSLRATLLHEHSKLCSEAELFLFLADRAQHVQEVIKPALAKNFFVLCDRYVDSTIAYQGAGRGLDIESLIHLHRLCTNDLWPDLTLLLDVPVEVGMSRASLRNESSSYAKNEKRFDLESHTFHTKVRENYLSRVKEDPRRFSIIDANKAVSEVVSDCIIKLNTAIEQKVIFSLEQRM